MAGYLGDPSGGLSGWGSRGHVLPDRGLDVVGARVFDLQIAVTALDHGATEVWSHDRRFITPPGLRLVDPLEP